MTSTTTTTPRSDPAPDAVVVVVPVYKAEPSELERFSLAQSCARLDPRRRVVLVGPEGLDLTAYRHAIPRFEWMPFHPSSFATIQGYSRLLLSAGFYRAFDAHEFMLVLQADALLLRDELDAWACRPFDYVGAPWPTPVELFVNLDRHAGPGGHRVRATHGNGGFSLRRIRACLALLDEFPQARDMFVRTGSSEDLFFAVLGSVSTQFVLPNEITAGCFSREIDPRRYHAMLGAPPMGGHAWWKYDADYWIEQLGAASEQAAALVAAQRAPAARAA